MSETYPKSAFAKRFLQNISALQRRIRWQRYRKFVICANKNRFLGDFLYTIGGRAYPVRHYPIAMRLRDRKGRAILCIALFPQSGDSSGAILGVRSVALLHLTKRTLSYTEIGLLIK